MMRALTRTLDHDTVRDFFFTPKAACLPAVTAEPNAMDNPFAAEVLLAAFLNDFSEKADFDLLSRARGAAEVLLAAFFNDCSEKADVDLLSRARGAAEALLAAFLSDCSEKAAFDLLSRAQGT